MIADSSMQQLLLLLQNYSKLSSHKNPECQNSRSEYFSTIFAAQCILYTTLYFSFQKPIINLAVDENLAKLYFLITLLNSSHGTDSLYFCPKINNLLQKNDFGYGLITAFIFYPNLH